MSGKTKKEQQLRDRQKSALATPCVSPDHLHQWLIDFLGLNVPRTAVCPHHVPPFDYLTRAYFEPASDLVVWAPRGGGKTRLGAVATLLDLLHKPPVQARILGGSLDQSFKMWEHLRDDLERLARDKLLRFRPTARVIELDSGAKAAVLPQSQRAVRGLRVQKLRCDEVEMFDEDVFEAAQLTTRSTTDHAGRPIRGTIEAISTFHNAWGLMNKIVARAREQGTPILQWRILDVLERCPPERDCQTCPLWDDCGGVAKTKCDGFYSIDDAIVQKRRVSVETWKSEMLCQWPSTQGAVFKSFDRAVHVREDDVDPGRVHELAWGIDFGFANPFVCLWIAVTRHGEVHVVDEYVRRECVMHENLAEVESRGRARPAWVGCDPAGSAKNEQTAQSNVDLLRRRGYRVRTCGSRIVDGIEQIRFALQPAAGAPVLFINQRCAELIKALECYHYDPAARRGENPEKDGVHDHLIDALRYFFVNRGRGKVAVRPRY